MKKGYQKNDREKIAKDLELLGKVRIFAANLKER
jgi:hypothetical protein